MCFKWNVFLISVPQKILGLIGFYLMKSGSDLFELNLVEEHYLESTNLLLSTGCF